MQHQEILHAEFVPTFTPAPRQVNGLGLSHTRCSYYKRMIFQIKVKHVENLIFSLTQSATSFLFFSVRRMNFIATDVTLLPARQFSIRMKKVFFFSSLALLDANYKSKFVHRFLCYGFSLSLVSRTKHVPQPLYYSLLKVFSLHLSSFLCVQVRNCITWAANDEKWLVFFSYFFFFDSYKRNLDLEHKKNCSIFSV